MSRIYGLQNNYRLQITLYHNKDQKQSSKISKVIFRQSLSLQYKSMYPEDKQCQSTRITTAISLLVHRNSRFEVYLCKTMPWTCIVSDMLGPGQQGTCFQWKYKRYGSPNHDNPRKFQSRFNLKLVCRNSHASAKWWLNMYSERRQ